MKYKVFGFENYTIDEEGIIRNSKDRTISPFIDCLGYKQIVLYKDGKRYHKRVHRLLYQSIYGELNIKIQVNHIDGDKTNNNITNLEAVTNQQNTQHGYDNNLYHSKKRSIPVRVFDKEGNILSDYKSIRSMCDDLHLNRKTISSIIYDGRTNNTNYEFKFYL